MDFADGAKVISLSCRLSGQGSAFIGRQKGFENRTFVRGRQDSGTLSPLPRGPEGRGDGEGGGGKEAAEKDPQEPEGRRCECVRGGPVLRLQEMK